MSLPTVKAPPRASSELSPTTLPAPTVAPPATAQLTELFSSFQGEGPLVGVRQLFARFSHCHLKCTYCDTAMSNADGACHLHWPADIGAHDRLPNPVAPSKFIAAIKRYQAILPHHSLSLTGGEPLLYHRFLADIAPKLANIIPLYLETSGTQPEFYETVAPYMAHVAMDIKLPSASGEPWHTKEHREFLRLATQPYAPLNHQPPHTFAKVILNDKVTRQELVTLGNLMAGYEHVPLFLQPESAVTHHETDPLRLNCSPQTLEQAYQTLSAKGLQVRVVPQTHKLINIR